MKRYRANILYLYLAGWTIPWIWAGIWSIITTYWVKAALKDEKRQWCYSQIASTG